jgi:hypothetical protein
MKAYTPLKLMAACQQVKSIPDVFKTDYPTLGKVKRTYGAPFTEKYIAAWIVNVIDFFQVGKKMGEQQIIETAMMVVDDYWMLNLADVNLIFTRAKKGYFGELYDRLDGGTILGWFRAYLDERHEAAEHLSAREHEAYKRGNSERTTGREVQAMKEAIKKHKISQMLNAKNQEQ